MSWSAVLVTSRLSYLLVFGGASLLCLLSAWRARQITDPDVQRGLLSLLLTTTLWAGAYVGFLLSTGSWFQLVWYEIGLTVGFATVWAWLWFCSAYTGRSLHRHRGVRVAVVVTFLVVTITKLTNSFHGLYFSSAPSSIPFEHLAIYPEVLYWITMALSYALAGIGFFMLLEFLLSVRGETTPLVILSVLTGLPALISGIGYGSPLLLNAPHDSIGVAIFSVGTLFFYQGPFETVRRAGTASRPVFVVGTDHTIRSHNDDAATLVAALASSTPDPASLVGHRLDDVLPGTPFPLDEDRPIRVETDTGHRYYRLTDSPLGGGPAGRMVVLTDVTVEEERRRRRDARLEGVSSSIPGVVFELYVPDAGSPEVRFVSERGYDLLGLPPDRDDVFSWFADRIPEPDRSSVERAVRVAAAHRTDWNEEIPFDPPTGDRRWLLGAARPDVQDDGVLFSGVLLDITDRKAAEQALIEAKDTAEEAARMKTALLSNLNHEFRTPLTSIVSFSEIVKEKPDLADRFATQIHSGGQRLLHTLNTVMDFAELEKGSFSSTPNVFDLRQVVASVTDDLRDKADRKSLALHIEAADAPMEVRLDPHATERICFHLLSNAIKFTDEGTVTVRLHTTDQEVTLSIQDTGVGIAPEAQANLYKEFFQVSSGLDRSYEGNGLGLTIVKRLVDRMDGTITIDSTPGEGTCVTVSLPTAPVASPA